MEMFETAKKSLLMELTSNDAEIRAEYVNRFQADMGRFTECMAQAFLNWRTLDDEVKSDEKRAYISALVFIALTLHISSMKLFLSGPAVPSGNLYRQVVETMALAMLCSGKELRVLERFIEGKYSTNNAVRDVMRHSAKLGLDKNAVGIFGAVQDFYHKFSHLSMLTIGTGMSFSKRGVFIGAAFDEGKMEVYKIEIRSRVGCAEVFSNFIDGVKANVAKW
jgi:hypothetical protein